MATNLIMALVNLNLYLSVSKYFNLIMPTGNVRLNHHRLVAHSGKSEMNLGRFKLGNNSVKWMWRIIHGLECGLTIFQKLGFVADPVS